MTLILHACAKTFPPNTRALHPSDLEIAEGEILSLLGPSGCGKTTLLRVIAGLERPDPGGRIVFNGEDVTHQPVERRRIGMVFQNYALFPNLTTYGNVAYGLRMQRLKRGEIAARVKEVLELCRLQRYAERAVASLSGGQRQRVALARAIAPRPRVLLLDEPLSALDASLRESLRDELALLLRRFGTTSVFVTHDQSEALAISDRVAVMCEGRIHQVGTPERLYRRPADAFVARFVGNAQPLSGRADGDQLQLPGGVLRLPVPANGRCAFVRAEDLRLSAGGSLTGRVETRTFLGTHYRLMLSGVTHELLLAYHAGSQPPQPGETVSLTVAPERILLVPS